jgi:vacuolar-type H+-ATPase subunit C/Vma6
VTVSDLRLRLHEKDYAKSLSGVGQKLNVALVRQALEKHLCDDFALLHHHARPPLKKFLDYVT